MGLEVEGFKVLKINFKKVLTRGWKMAYLCTPILKESRKEVKSS